MSSRKPWADFHWGSRSYLMGILNVTPDSFSDGGAFLDVTQARVRAQQMATDGADVIDVGAESTRPDAAPVSDEEEWARLEPVLAALNDLPARLPISVDTTKATVAERAFARGWASILNDVHGLQGEPELAQVAARYSVGVVVMHNARIAPVTGDLVASVRAFFEKSLAIAAAAGISREAVVLDPGIGFGLTPAQSLELLRRLPELRGHGLPLLLGTSRKSVLGHLLSDPDPANRLEATLATTALGVAAGVDCFRVHDVGANRRAALVADALVRPVEVKS